jgi:hypothetical protein
VRSREAKPETSSAPDGMESRALSNMEIVTLAVFLLGGDSHYVDTEDIAVKANELAPDRFTWVKYKDQINIHVIKTHLWDAKSERRGNLLLGSEKEGWMLSASGFAMARSRVDALKHLKAAKRKLSAPEMQWMRAERVRLAKSDAYEKIAAGNAESVTLEEAEAFFRLNAYIVGKARDRKILRVMNIFGNDPELGPAVQALAEKVRSR